MTGTPPRIDGRSIDFERLRLHVPEIRYDLPAGGRRLVQGLMAMSRRSCRALPCSKTATIPVQRPVDWCVPDRQGLRFAPCQRERRECPFSAPDTSYGMQRKRRQRL